ncbi:MAG: spermidine/putrescine transport system substrate-binding protein [Thermoleophilaceae bacterium]|jgi:spermidine/putrescine transport system substrate-binding protein|nr:spermidine/putrescine transport system substrate-binding protein [Thermoleophilaceae bacterium]
MTGVSRRDLLRGGAGLALSAGLAGCQLNSGIQGSTADTRKKVAKRVDGDLVYFNWAEYVDPELLKGFEKRYGVKVRESNFDSMPAMAAKLRAGISYDVIFPSAEFAQRLIRGNQLLVIDRDNLRNVDTVYDHFTEPWYDRGSAHSTPYTMYATGLGYRADKIGELTGSWRDLVSPEADGRTFMLDDFQEGIGMANLLNGYDLNTVDPEELDRSKDLLIELKPELRGFSSDTITNMASGNAWIQHLWNGDVVNIRYQVDNPEDFKFQKCQEGIPVGSDVFAIPVNAEHPGTALLFIEYMLEPENAARNVEWIGYPMPYEGGASEAFAGLVKDDPSIEVTVSDLDNGEQYENLEGDGRRAWDRTWTEVKVA